MRDEAYARSRWWLVSAAVGSLIACVVLAGLRVEPQVWGDPGVWLSVAARLLEGDRLYADVFDNKDPLFFYSYAAALWIGGVRGPFVLEVAWLALGTFGMALALRALRVGAVAALAGALVYPFALTAAWYVPGATMVPALALAPIALWLWVRGSPAGAGAVVAVAMLVKLNLGLVVVAPLVALLALGADGSSRRRCALHGVAGAALALAVAGAVLAARGELGPYADTIAYNVYYSNAGIDDGGIATHLEIVRVFFAASGKWQLPAAELAAAVLLIATVVGWRHSGPAFRRVSAASVTTLAAAIVTLAFTAIFVVHVQLLAYPAALGTATVVVALGSVWRPLGALAASACVVFAAWSSLKHEDLSQLSLRAWTAEPVSTPGLALESTRARWFGEAHRVTYAVFGRNTEDGHAAFVDETMDLRCRYFRQYPFYRERQLDETIDCVRGERPMLVLVTTSFYDPISDDAWETFVARARALLRSRYALVTEEGMSQVWRRR
jgi:hypothetical protein